MKLHTAEARARAESLYLFLDGALTEFERKYDGLFKETGKTKLGRFAQGETFRLRLTKMPSWSALTFKDTVCEARFSAYRGGITLRYRVEPTYARDHVLHLHETQGDIATRVAKGLCLWKTANNGVYTPVRVSIPGENRDEEIVKFLSAHMRR